MSLFNFDQATGRKALYEVFRTAKKPKYQTGLIISEAVFNEVKEALGFDDRIVIFGDRQAGCRDCGAYADPVTYRVEHAKSCDEARATDNGHPR